MGQLDIPTRVGVGGAAAGVFISIVLAKVPDLSALIWGPFLAICALAILWGFVPVIRSWVPLSEVAASRKVPGSNSGIAAGANSTAADRASELFVHKIEPTPALPDGRGNLVQVAQITAIPKAKFKVSFKGGVDRWEPNPPHSTPQPAASYVHNTQHLCRFLNIEIEALTGEAVNGCRAFIVAASKRIVRRVANDQPPLEQFLEIPLSNPIEMEAIAFDVLPHIPKVIELVKTTSLDQSTLQRTNGWPPDVAWVFKYTGIYRFKIVVYGGGVSAAPICIQVRNQAMWEYLAGQEVPWEEPIKFRRETTEQWLRQPETH